MVVFVCLPFLLLPLVDCDLFLLWHFSLVFYNIESSRVVLEFSFACPNPRRSSQSGLAVVAHNVFCLSSTISLVCFRLKMTRWNVPLSFH